MELPKRKHPRLKGYDYRQNGYYYITINTHKNRPVLSNIGRTTVTLMPIGKIAEEQLVNLEKRYDNVTIDKYVIMPTHIHFIIVLNSETAGASRRPLTDIICAYKSLTTRICNQNDNVSGRKIFQTSFYEKIIRNDNSYVELCKYIDENPLKCEEDPV